MQISHLFAGKPIPFGPRGAPSSIIKQAQTSLDVKFDGAIEDEQGNKKLHGGPYMALHQYAQSNYAILAKQFTESAVPFERGSIGENLSAPDMNENNVFIGNQYKIGSCIVQVVSPRAPCSKINHRYQAASKQKVDLFIAEHALTGWYYSVVKEGTISVGDPIELIKQGNNKLNIAVVWRLREFAKTLDKSTTKQAVQAALELADLAVNEPTLAPEWQAHINRVAVKLSKIF
jgi:MOSC domain-containing protein YiiM